MAKFLHQKMTATSAPLDYFAFRLSQMIDRPVVDLTGLHGGYDFTLEYTRELPPGFPDGGKINGEDPDTSGPTVFEAVRRQLGLALKAQKGPVDVIVIDHAESPAGIKQQSGDAQSRSILVAPVRPDNNFHILPKRDQKTQKPLSTEN